MKKCYYIVHDREGRILALMPAAAAETKDGVQVGWRPLAGVNQFVAEVQLTAAHARLPPQEFIEQYLVRLNAKAGVATLHRRPLRLAAESAITSKRGQAARHRHSS